ncbi:hypothetical protein C3L33_20024, partial [Rhododendron williamsianum]
MATMENLPKNMAVTTAETPAATDLWYRLPGDILKSIAKRLTDKADAAAASTNYINALGLLRSVCKSWRSSIEKPSSSLLSLLPLTLPFPIVPFRNPNSNRGRHFSLTHSTLYFLSPLSPTPTAGWLLRVQEPPSRNNNNGSKTYHPLNPLSKLEPPERAPRAAAFPESLNLLEVGIAEIGRAHCLKVVDEREKKKKQEVEEKFKRRTMAECQAEYEDAYTTYIKKVAVSLEDYGVVVAIHSGRLCFHKLGGDQKWTLIDSSNDLYHDVVYRKGKYFAVDYRGRTVVIDGADLKKEVMVTRLVESPLPNLGACQFTRLVDSGNDLFLVDRYLDPEEGQCTLSIGAVTMGMITEESHPPMTNYFNVYKLDEENKKWELVDDLNHQVFFLGDDYLFSVSAQDFPGLKGNCIYFSDCMFRARNEKEANIGKSCS